MEKDRESHEIEPAAPRVIARPFPDMELPLYLSNEEFDDDQVKVIQSEIEVLVRDFYRARLEKYEKWNRKNPSQPQP